MRNASLIKKTTHRKGCVNGFARFTGLLFYTHHFLSQKRRKGPEHYRPGEPAAARVKMRVNTYTRPPTEATVSRMSPVRMKLFSSGF